MVNINNTKKNLNVKIYIYKYTRTLGAYGPLVLAPVEGVGALWPPAKCGLFVVYFCLY